MTNFLVAGLNCFTLENFCNCIKSLSEDIIITGSCKPNSCVCIVSVAIISSASHSSKCNTFHGKLSFISSLKSLSVPNIKFQSNSDADLFFLRLPLYSGKNCFLQELKPSHANTICPYSSLYFLLYILRVFKQICRIRSGSSILCTIILAKAI